MPTIKPLTRDQLAKFLPDQEAIRRFEELYQVAATDNPDAIAALVVLVEETTIAAESAMAAATMANDSLIRITDSLAILASTPTVQIGTIAEQNADEVFITGGTITAAITGNQSTVLMSSSQALVNGAGVAAGTLANAPTAGDPTKWIRINDNGTVRNIPSWT